MTAQPMGTIDPHDQALQDTTAQGLHVSKNTIEPALSNYYSGTAYSGYLASYSGTAYSVPWLLGLQCPWLLGL